MRHSARAACLEALLFMALATPLPAAAGILDRILPGSAPTVSGDFIPQPELYFSPKGGCTAAIVRELEAAKQTVFVQAYSFTSAPIAGALVAAARRGVHVEAVLDKSNKTGKYTEADFLVNSGIPTWIDDRHAIAHNKVMVIDGATVLTGSFNFTKAAEESNAENLIILRSPKLANSYTTYFFEHRKHSYSYSGR